MILKNKTFVVLLILSISACAHQPVTWDRTKQAATDAVVHPAVWAPLVGAGLFIISNEDNRTVQHAQDSTPVFGSNENAETASDTLQYALLLTAGASALMIPDRDSDNKATGRSDHFSAYVSGALLTGGLTETLKAVVNRERPNGRNNNSFPSGHASFAFFSATSASENFHRLWGDDARAQWTDAGLYTAASLTAWARVEAGKHHPSDVLAGAALGNYIGRFVNELFLKNIEDTSLSAYYDGKNFSIGIQQAF